MGSVETRGTGAYCLVPCRTSVLAVSLDAVETIMEAVRLLRLPLCPRPVTALCPYRGGFLPILGLADDREARGVTPIPGGGRPAILVLRAGPGPLGLMIDRRDIAVVEDVLRIEAGDLAIAGGAGSPPPEGLVVAGSIERDGQSHALIDPDRTWTALRGLIERGYGQREIGESAAVTSTGDADTGDARESFQGAGTP